MRAQVRRPSSTASVSIPPFACMSCGRVLATKHCDAKGCTMRLCERCACHHAPDLDFCRAHTSAPEPTP